MIVNNDKTCVFTYQIYSHGEQIISCTQIDDHIMLILCQVVCVFFYMGELSKCGVSVCGWCAREYSRKSTVEVTQLATLLKSVGTMCVCVCKCVFDAGIDRCVKKYIYVKGVTSNSSARSTLYIGTMYVSEGERE